MPFQATLDLIQLLVRCAELSQGSLRACWRDAAVLAEEQGSSPAQEGETARQRECYWRNYCVSSVSCVRYLWTGQQLTKRERRAAGSQGSWGPSGTALCAPLLYAPVAGTDPWDQMGRNCTELRQHT